MSNLTKVKAVAQNFEYHNNFGHAPLLLGFVTNESSLISVGGVIAALIAAAAGGPLLMALVVIACFNDVRHISDKEKGVQHNAPIGMKELLNTTGYPSKIEDIEPATIPSPEPLTLLTQSAAIVVPAQPIAAQPSVVSHGIVAQNFAPPIAAAAPDYLARVKNVVRRNMLFFVCGSRGSGKGMAVANLLRWKLDQYPNAIVVAFDPKKDDKESGYWDHPRIIRHAVDLTYSKKEQWDEQLNDFIDTAHHYLAAADVVSGKHVFILIDEVLSIKKKASKNVYAEIEGLIATCVGMGSSKGQHMILVTQSFNAGDAGLSDELVQNMCLLGTFREDEFDRTAKIIKTGRASAVDFDRSAFANLTRKSPVERVMCLAGDFIPAPKLTNYSSWDRDSNTVVLQPKPAAIKAEELPIGMQAIAQLNQAMFTGEGKTESATDRFQTLLVNALSKAMTGDAKAAEAIQEAKQLLELGQKTQAVEALAQYA